MIAVILYCNHNLEEVQMKLDNRQWRLDMIMYAEKWVCLSVQKCYTKIRDNGWYCFRVKCVTHMTFDTNLPIFCFYIEKVKEPGDDT